MSFLRATLPENLQADFEAGLDLERAHQSLLPAKPGAPPRPFIVRFLRFQQKERVRGLAQEMGDVLPHSIGLLIIIIIIIVFYCSYRLMFFS